MPVWQQGIPFLQVLVNEANGADIKTIQKFLGHSQASTTVNTYLHGVTYGGEIAAHSMMRLLENQEES